MSFEIDESAYPCHLLLIRQLQLLLPLYWLKSDMKSIIVEIFILPLSLLANDSQSLEFLSGCSGSSIELLGFFLPTCFLFLSCGFHWSHPLRSTGKRSLQKVSTVSRVLNGFLIRNHWSYYYYYFF